MADTYTFGDFLEAVSEQYKECVCEIDGLLTVGGCKVKIENKRSGFFVGYRDKRDNAPFLNLLFRKKGMICRMYADKIGAYDGFADAAPKALQQKFSGAPDCKILTNTADCSSTCKQGYTYTLGGNTLKKCRCNAFMMEVVDENLPYIKQFVINELEARMA